jgi:hypothetical protein
MTVKPLRGMTDAAQYGLVFQFRPPDLQETLIALPCDATASAAILAGK